MVIAIFQGPLPRLDRRGHDRAVLGGRAHGIACRGGDRLRARGTGGDLGAPGALSPRGESLDHAARVPCALAGPCALLPFTRTLVQPRPAGRPRRASNVANDHRPGPSAVIAGPAHAASYDNCTGFIEQAAGHDLHPGRVVPAQGPGHGHRPPAPRSTSTANNVTIDCNDFKLGGLAGGHGHRQRSAWATVARQNITVRNCTVRGFHHGIYTAGDDHMVENNRFDLNTLIAIRTEGDGNEIRNNVVTSTGGDAGSRRGHCDLADGTGGRVLDNRIHGVSAELSGSTQLSAGVEVMDGRARGTASAACCRPARPTASACTGRRARQRRGAGRRLPGFGIVC